MQSGFYCMMHIVQSAVLLSIVLRPSVCDIDVPWGCVGLA